MIRPIVPKVEGEQTTAVVSPAPESRERMDPLSEVLALLRPRAYVSGGFWIPGDLAICFPQHQGVKCYALLAGKGWIWMEGAPEPVSLREGDCFLLPRGMPFQLTTDLSLEPVHYLEARDRFGAHFTAGEVPPGGCFMAGGFFSLEGAHARMLLDALPPIVHIRKESERADMRWALERMKEELREARPGGALIAQQLASSMLVQALRLHMEDRASEGVGWLFALADRQIGAAIRCIHERPGRPWTLQELAASVGMSRSVFALRFKERVGVAAMEYVTRWRMVLASERLRNSTDSMAEIASSLGYESESAFGGRFGGRWRVRRGNLGVDRGRLASSRFPLGMTASKGKGKSNCDG